MKSIISVSPDEIIAYEEGYRDVFTIALSKKIIRWIIGSFFLSFLLYSLWKTDFFEFVTIGNGFKNLVKVLSFMLPPAHNGWIGDFVYGILETMAMAFLGTLLAAIVSIPLGFCAAKNVCAQKIFHFLFRRVFDVIRGVDSLIWALIFVNVVGLGPFAGIMAIAVSDIGTLTKLFSEAIENIDTKQVEGVFSSGATKVQLIRYAIFPQIFPVIVSNALYFFESNIRSATILGVVGAGGIGLQLSDRIRVNNWDEASCIILLILITVSIIDTLSKKVRLKIIGGKGK